MPDKLKFKVYSYIRYILCTTHYKTIFSMFCLVLLSRQADSYTHCHATIQHISDSLISHYIDSETRKVCVCIYFKLALK